MKNKTAKQIIAGCRLKFAGVVLVYVLGLVASIFILSKVAIVGIACIIMLAASVKLPFDKIIEKDVESVIYEELDPVKFNEILELGLLKNSVRHQVLAAMSLGDHERVFAIIENTKNKEINPVEKCNNLYRKGYVCFERENFDGLREVLRDFGALKKQFSKYSPIFDNYTVFEKFDAMLDEDYEYVVDACEYDVAHLNPKHQNKKITKLNVSFYRAVALYRMGELEKAREAFEEIIEFAPKMHKATLSKEYLKRMDV